MEISQIDGGISEMSHSRQAHLGGTMAVGGVLSFLREDSYFPVFLIVQGTRTGMCFGGENSRQVIS